MLLSPGCTHTTQPNSPVANYMLWQAMAAESVGDPMQQETPVCCHSQPVRHFNKQGCYSQMLVTCVYIYIYI